MKKNNIIINFIIKYNTLVVFIFIFILSSIISDVFLTNKNITNLLRQVSALSVVSFGMLFVVLTGGIDLSVGSVIAVSSVVFSLVNKNYGFLQSLGISILTCLVIGMISGFMVSRMRLAPFIATLAMMTIARGLALNLSQGSPIQIKNYVLYMIGKGYLIGIPVSIFISFLFSLFYLFY